MKICHGCGGVLGRDCFNEQDCIAITQSQNNFDQQHLQQIQSELEWERRVVVPDLEQKLNGALITVYDLCIMLQNKELEKHERDYVSMALAFYSININHVNHVDKTDPNDLPF